MKKIKLKAAPRGRILSNNELKNILAGRGDISKKCTCKLTLSTQKIVDYNVPSGESSEQTCLNGCHSACVHYEATVGSTTAVVCLGYSANYDASASGTI